jgi:NAD(P)-dependent dehydrogenase (short-subunit alcohol dehydrogenase family)
MTQNVEGKVVVITGASSGLGEATAQHLAAAGAKLVLGARRLDRLQALAGELGLGTDAAVQTDVTDREEVKALVDHAVTMHGHLDVIVNNAGLMPHSPLERGKVDDWDRMIDVNLKGVVYGVAADPVEKWAHHQRIVGRRPQGPPGQRRLCGHQSRGANRLMSIAVADAQQFDARPVMRIAPPTTRLHRGL